MVFNPYRPHSVLQDVILQQAQAWVQDHAADQDDHFQSTVGMTTITDLYECVHVTLGETTHLYRCSEVRSYWKNHNRFGPRGAYFQYQKDSVDDMYFPGVCAWPIQADAG